MADMNAVLEVIGVLDSLATAVAQVKSEGKSLSDWGTLPDYIPVFQATLKAVEDAKLIPDELKAMGPLDMMGLAEKTVMALVHVAEALVK